MAIKKEFLIGEGKLGSQLRVTITSPDLEVVDYNTMTTIMSVSPVRLDKVIEVEGLYVFPQAGQDWEIVPETGELNRITLTGARVE